MGMSSGAVKRGLGVGVVWLTRKSSGYPTLAGPGSRERGPQCISRTTTEAMATGGWAGRVSVRWPFC